MNVREAFLHNPKNSGLQFLRESLETIWNFQSYFDFATLFKSFQEQAETRGKTNLIQKRRMQQMSDRSYLVGEVVYQAETLLDGFGGSGRDLSILGLHRSQGHAQGSGQNPPGFGPWGFDSPSRHHA